MTVKEKVERAFCQFMARDHYLLTVKANERSLTHRLAIYIENEFPDYHVDSEFQKNKKEQKILLRFKRSKAPNSGLAYPDIIVHHRGMADNYIVIEAKTTETHGKCKSSMLCKCDRCKLRAYVDQLKYRNAYYIVFPVGQALKTFSFEQIDKYLFPINGTRALADVVTK